MGEHRSIVGQAEPVRVRMLGGFSVSVGNRALREDAWRLRKVASLVKLLTLAPGHRLHREQVMDLLWPDSGKKSASNNLRGALHALRRSLAISPTTGSRYLLSEDESLVMCPKGELWVDVEAFEEAAAMGRRAQDPAAYRAAIDLYGGELLPGDRYENWAEGKREELRRLYLALLVELAGLYEERREYGPAIEVLHKLVMVEPTSEEAHAGLMRLYACSGHQAEALQQYERLRGALRRELGTGPDAATRRLRKDIEAGSFAQTRPAPAELSSEDLPDADKHNLPAPRSSFVGREREMLEVKRELAMTRLLTLTGAGGSGKTRLALEVTRELVGAYPDGAWLVDLAPLSEGGLVPQAAAGAFGVHEQPDRSLTDTLTETLRTKQTLLVMDNCEHLMDAVARLADVLLDSCPRLRILATSREALGIAGEVVWFVPPLSVPEQTRSPSVEELEGYESARLLVERARRRNLAFVLTSENAEAVAEICRRLEGLPLAIELAAARVGLSAEQIAARLGESLKLLTGGSRTAVPRQQTLRGTLDWSYELLSEREQTLFRRLSVFAGGWTLAVAEVVGSGEGIEAADVLDLLSGLVDKSLVVADASGKSGGVRYRMLEPIRQYAREKLEVSREAEETLRRHAEFFLALAEEAETRWQGPEESIWLDRLEVEHDNLRMALSWSLEGGDPRTGLRLAAAASWFWDLRVHLSESTRWLEKALVKAGVGAPVARAEALRRLGDILMGQGDFEGAEARLEEALAGYEELGERARAATCLASLGWVAEYQGDIARAVALLEKSLALARESENLKIVPNILNALGWTAFDDGEFGRAKALWEEALELERQLGSNMVASQVLFNLGYTELARGNQERAIVFLEEGLTIGRKLGDKAVVSANLIGLGIAATLKGEPKLAKDMLKEGLAIELELGNRIDIPESLEALAGVAGALGEDLRAARLWGAADALREVIDIPWAPAERMLHEPQLSATRSRIDGAIWDKGFGEGQIMGLEEAVEYALSKEKSDPPATPAPEDLSTSEPLSKLTRRESEVASLLTQGLTNRQIASELVLSEHTVHRHVAGILKKLDLHSRTQIASSLAE